MRTFITCLAVLILSFTFGCTKPEKEGTAEKAGKQMDQAVEDAKEYTGEKMKEAGEAIEHMDEDKEVKE